MLLAHIFASKPGRRYTGMGISKHAIVSRNYYRTYDELVPTELRSYSRLTVANTTRGNNFWLLSNNHTLLAANQFGQILNVVVVLISMVSVVVIVFNGCSWVGRIVANGALFAETHRDAIDCKNSAFFLGNNYFDSLGVLGCERLDRSERKHHFLQAVILALALQFSQSRSS